MTTPMNPGMSSISQSLSPGLLIHLYTLDATAQGGDTYNWTPHPAEEGFLQFNGVKYYSVDIEASEFEVNGTGSLPTPRLMITNVNGVISSILGSTRLEGSKVIRIRTFYHFLDGQPGANGSMFYPPDVYVIDRKVAQNKRYVEFELASIIDQQGKMVPGRQVLRDTCTHIYRRYTGQGSDGFSYAKATCPYSGAGCYNRKGEVTTPDKDDCGRKPSDCKLRFGADGELFTRAFPGVNRYGS